MKRVAWTAILVLATLTALVVVWQFLEAVVIFLLALTLSAILRPAVEFFQRRGLSRAPAAGLVYTACLLLGAALLLPVGSLVLGELHQAVIDFGQAYAYVDAEWARGNPLQRLIAERLPPLEEVPQTFTDLPPAVLVERLFGVSQGLLGLMISVSVIFVLSLYWTFDSPRLERLWLSLLPLAARTRAQTAWEQIVTDVGAYMRSELAQSLIAAVVLAVLFGATGFPYPTTTAVIAALAWLVPWLGPALAAATVWLATTVNLIDVTPTANLARGLVGSGLVLAVFAGLELLVEPRLVGRRHYSSLLVVLIVLGLIDLIGIAGIILGPPVAVAVQILVGHYLWPSEPQPHIEPIEDLSSLRQRIEEVRQELQGLDESWSLQMKSILDRLRDLLEETSQAAAVSLPPAGGGRPSDAVS